MRLGLTPLSEAHMWTIEQARNDVRVVFRSLRKTPVYAATAVATLAIGMGTAAAAFCITYNIAYRPLPFADADRLVRVYESNPAANELKHDVSQATFYEWSSALKSVDGIALIGRPATRFVPGDPPTPVIVSAVSPSFFHLLGVAPIHGEVFKSDAHYTPPAREIVISYATAKRYFNDERNAVGRTLQL